MRKEHFDLFVGREDAHISISKGGGTICEIQIMVERVTMQALLRGAIACAVVLWCAVAQADSLKHPSGFTFNLPDIGKNWEQEIKGDLIILSDESDTFPELTVYVFPAKQEGTLAEIQGRLQAEVARPGVALAGEAIKTVKVVAAKPETIADATALRGSCKLNADNAPFAIIQRGGKSLIAIGVPAPGTFQRATVNFREVVRGLQKGAGASTAKPAAAKPAADVSKIVAAMMPEIAIIKNVTATSTFVDKKKKNAYAPENVIWFDVAADKVLDSVPKTAWCEGKPDEGIGETLTIAFARPEHLDSIELAGGVWLTEKLFGANNQITSVEVSVDGKPSTVSLKAERAWVNVKIGRPVSTLAIKIASVKKGKMNDSCISGVRLHRGGGLEVAREAELPADAVAALPAGLAKIQAALLDPSYQSLQNVLAFPFTYDYSGGPKKAKYGSWKALEAVCKKSRGDGGTESKCPSATFFEEPQTSDAGKLTIQTIKTSELAIDFPPVGRMINTWRVKWRDGAWRLAAVENVEQTMGSPD